MGSTELQIDFDAIISRLQRQIDLVKEIRAVATDNPQLAGDLVASLTAASNGKTPTGALRGKPTAFDHIKRFLSNEANRWTSVKQIASGAGVKKSTVTQVLYNTHKQYFERRSSPADPRWKEWRLKEGGAS